MKKIIILIFAISSLAYLNGCKDRLEEDVYSFLSPTNFYNNYEQARSGVLSVNVVLAEMWHGFRGLRDALNYQVDDATLGGANGIPSSIEVYYYNNLTSAAANIKHTYTQCYKGVFLCNAIIDALDLKDFEGMDELVGEAKFYRAYFYFNLVRLYGKVPLILSFEDAGNADQFPRANLQDIYDQIISDLNFAELNMPIFSEKGRPGKYAASAMLADVYLTMAGEPLKDVSKLPLSVEKAKSVVESGVYDLFDDFDKATNILFNNGIEHIFSVQMEKDVVNFVSQTGNWYMPTDWFGDENGGAPGRAYMRPTQELIDQFEIGDERFDDSFVQWYPNKKNEIIPLNPRNAKDAYIFKYKIVNMESHKQIPNSFDADWHIYRFADALLILAEAENLLNGPTPTAYSAINRVRKRAELAPLVGLDQQSFFNAVKRERRVEFFFESKRRFDLVRWGELVETISAKFPERNIKDYNVLWPIPIAELQTNPGLKGEQNPGY